MTPKMQAARPIQVHVKAVDGYRATRSFKTLAGAQAFAQRYVGPTPELGLFQAVAPDGVVTVSVDGASLEDLFPALAPPPPPPPLSPQEQEEQDNWEAEARTERQAENAWLRHAERYDPEAQEDLRRFDEEFPNGYGR